MSSGIGLDVRLPIGIMFTLFGVIISIYGMVSDPAIYQRSLDININLWWGLRQSARCLSVAHRAATC